MDFCSTDFVPKYPAFYCLQGAPPGFVNEKKKVLNACKFWAADAHALPVTSLEAPGSGAAAAAINRAPGQGPASFISHTQRLFCSVFVTDQVISTASVCLPCANGARSM